MGRQRTIDDTNFWRSPRVADCSQEDKATLLYLLTSPSSNIIGVCDQEVAAISGHKSMQMLKRYTHLRAEDLVVKLDRVKA